MNVRMDGEVDGYDGIAGTAGGANFGAAIARIAAEKQLDLAALAAAAELDLALVTAVCGGSARISSSGMARLARALRLRPIAFLQQTGLLGLATYASGLDPLYFLPNGQTRFDARIYMREINPRHAVPEGDMTKRNPVLAALNDDTVIDPLGKIELELAYLLRAAIQGTGGVL